MPGISHGLPGSQGVKGLSFKEFKEDHPDVADSFLDIFPKQRGGVNDGLPSQLIDKVKFDVLETPQHEASFEARVNGKRIATYLGINAEWVSDAGSPKMTEIFKIR